MKKISKFEILIAFGVLSPFISSNASALVNTQFSYGLKTNDWKQTQPVTTDSAKQSGNSVSASVDFDFIPAVPLAAGVFYHKDHSSGKDSETTITFSSSAAGIEIMTWVPMLSFKPFLKAGYVLLGSGEASLTYSAAANEANGVDSVSLKNGKVKGYDLTLGLTYDVVPFFSILLTYTLLNETTEYSKMHLKTSTGSEAELDLSSGVKVDNKGQVISLGIGFNI